MLSRVGHILTVVWGQAAVALTALIGIRLFTEILSPSAYGGAMLVQGGLTLLDSIGVAALSQTLIAQCGPLPDRQSREAMSQGLTKFFICWAMPAVAGVAGAASLVLAASLGDAAWTLLTPCIAIYVAGGALKVSILSICVLERRYQLQSVWLTLDSITGVVGVLISITCWRADAIGYVVGYCTASAACAALLSQLVSPSLVRGIFTRRDRVDSGPALAYGVPIAAMGPLGWLSSYIDRYILGIVLGTSEVGIFVATTGLAARPYSLLTAVLTNYYRPQYFVIPKDRSPAEHAKRIFRSWTMSSLVLGASGVAAFGFLGSVVADVTLAPEFHDRAGLLMTLFAIAQTFTITTHAADNAVFAMRGSRQLLYTQLVVALFTLPLIPLGVYFGGLVGGVAGRCGAEAMKLVAASLLAFRMLRHMQALEA